MGKRGPKATPTVTLKLRGARNIGRRAGEASPPAGIPEPPVWFSDEELEKWDALVGVLSKTKGLLTQNDGDALAMMCEAWCDFLHARKEIERDGATCFGEKGGAYLHPAVNRKNAAIARLTKLMDSFGMSPSARASVKVAASTADGNSKKKFFA